MKVGSAILIVILFMVVSLAASSSVRGAEPITLTQTEDHHVAELDSNQPYVAGYHVNTIDLFTREQVSATTITVSFPSADTTGFPRGSWLGAGMFVQAQDHVIINVDYGFYTMLVLDASGGLFLDIGFHQTRESTAPLQTPTADLLYSYTWRVSGIDPSDEVTLAARWDSEGSVHYSLAASGRNVTVFSVNVAGLPNCENIIRQFYAGDATNGNAFPVGHYVYYFQFGVISSEIIADNRWSADLKNPRILRKTGWSLLENAWSLQGDISYLDSDWLWGGSPYYGVSAQYHQNPLENPYEVVFFYNGQTLPKGTVLWQTTSNVNDSMKVSIDKLGQPVVLIVAASVLCVCAGFYESKRKAQLKHTS